MTGTRTAAESYETARRHGWLDAIERIVDEAPPVPANAVDILRASGFPAAQNHGSVNPSTDRHAS